MADPKPKRKFDINRYKTHTGARGNPEEWHEKARRLAAKSNDYVGALLLLGIDTLPGDQQTLSKAWKKAMLRAHPDRGGSQEEAAKVNSAHDMLAKLIDERKT